MSTLMQLMGESASAAVSGEMNTPALLLSLLGTFFLSACMMIVYRLCHDTLSYRRRFNITLVMLAFASHLLLAIIQNNPLFSLGALGALSICRIRTNTKDPRDLGFVFWALTIGISSAMGAFTVGLLGTIALSAVMLFLEKGLRKRERTMLVVRGEKNRIGQVQNVFRSLPGSSMQSQIMFPDSFELVYSMNKRKVDEESLMSTLGSMDGIYGVNILAPKTKVA